MTVRIPRSIDSPVLLVALLSLTGIVCFQWWTLINKSIAPPLPNYDWRQHRDVLLVYSPGSGCACQDSIPEIIRSASNTRLHDLEILLLSNNVSGLVSATENKPRLPLTMMVVNNPQLIKRISPKNSMMLMHIKDGWIARRAISNNLPDAFFGK